MPKQSLTYSDPDLLKPIIEALIFASEEPLPARSLVRLLAGEREDEHNGAPTLTDTSGPSSDLPMEAAEHSEQTTQPAISEVSNPASSESETGWREEEIG